MLCLRPEKLTPNEYAREARWRFAISVCPGSYVFTVDDVA